MKKLVSISVLVMMTMLFTTPVQAQVQTATLQHNDTLRVFTGEYSLSSAYNKAIEGDTIFLSPGTFRFSSGDIRITKNNISIQGCGQYSDSGLSLRETYINGTIVLGGRIDNENIGAFNISFEGLRINTISNYSYWGYVYSGNLHIKHCSIENFYMGGIDYIWIDQSRIKRINSPEYDYNSINIANSYIDELSAGRSQIVVSNKMAITNSYIGKFNSYDVCYFNNSIINGTAKPNSSCTAYNCVISEGLLNNILDKEGNYEVSDISSLFVEDYTATANFYKMTDEAAATYLGQDGTQVGMYGGQRPYTPVPSYPRIIEKSIAGQTTSDGKLRVYVKAEAQKK